LKIALEQRIAAAGVAGCLSGLRTLANLGTGERQQYGWSERRVRDKATKLGALIGPARVCLLAQNGQVSDDNECAEPNESRQADREQNPDRLNLLGVEVRDTHCSSTRQLRLWRVVQRDIGRCMRPPGEIETLTLRG
jgi:hypothetical protein